MKKHSQILLTFLAFLTLGSVLVLIQGEVPWERVISEAILRLLGTLDQWNPLLDERIPRLIVLISTGASLAVAGAVMQSLFQNALASPSLLGITSGGSLAGVLVFLFSLHLDQPFMLPLAAFSGCLATLLLVYGLSQFQKGYQINTLVLTGIAVSGLIFAIQGLILYAVRDNWTLIQTIAEWEAGSTIDRNWQHVHMQLPLTLVGLAGCLYYRAEMNILALGEEEALNLGLETKKMRWRLFLCIALLTGGALAAVGLVAFFGLVLPHLLRRAFGPNHQFLIPLCLIAGAASFVYLDLLIRLLDWHALSIGNVSAILGGLFFLYLLFQPEKRSIYGENLP